MKFIFHVFLVRSVWIWWFCVKLCSAVWTISINILSIKALYDTTLLIFSSQTTTEDNVNYVPIIDSILSVSRYGTSTSFSVSYFASSSVLSFKLCHPLLQERALRFCPSPSEVSCQIPQRNISSTMARWPRRPAAKLWSGSSSRTKWLSLTNR